MNECPICGDIVTEQDCAHADQFPVARMFSVRIHCFCAEDAQKDYDDVVFSDDMTYAELNRP